MSQPAPPIRLTGLTRPELASLVAEWGEKPYRAQQLWRWLHVRLASDVDAMSDLAKPLRQKLKDQTAPLRPTVVEEQASPDGTRKWLLELADGQGVETVYIPEEDRGTLCLSTQAGCTLDCPFCQTGRQGFARNLEAGEMVEQVLLARERLPAHGVSNVVLMGMGEPLYNYEAVRQAVAIINDETGIGIGTRKVTLSTAGVVPLMGRMGREMGVNLAISLHSVRDEVRDRLVPLNRKYDLGQLRQAALDFPLKAGRRITWEYLLLAGINDSLEDARELARYVAKIPSKINLLPYNPWPGSPFSPSPPAQTKAFQESLQRQGLATIQRTSRGGEVEAACGQLKGRLLGVRPRGPGA